MIISSKLFKRSAGVFILSALIATTFSMKPSTGSYDTTVQLIKNLVPKSKIGRAVLTVFLGHEACVLIRLLTKGGPKYEHSWKNFPEDFKNIFKAKSFSEFNKALYYLWDTYRVGIKFSLWPEYKEKYEDENGKWISIIDDKIKTKPFGIEGFKHAYVYLQLRKLIKLCAEISQIASAVQNYGLINIDSK